MIFNYKKFILSIRDDSDPKNQKTYNAWEKCNGGFIIEKEAFYENLSKYRPLKYKAPNYMTNEEKDLLLRLFCSSFSCDYKFDFSDDESSDGENIVLPELFIAVKAGSQSIVKAISVLKRKQIKKLFEILISEVIELQSLSCEPWDVFHTVPNFRKEYLERYNETYILINNQIKRRACYDI